MFHRAALLYRTDPHTGPALVAIALDAHPPALLSISRLDDPNILWLQQDDQRDVPDLLAFENAFSHHDGVAWRPGETTLSLQVRLTTDVQLDAPHGHQPWTEINAALRTIPDVTYFPKQQRLRVTNRLSLSVAPQLDVALDTLAHHQQQRARHLMHTLSLPNLRPTLALNTEIDLNTHT